MRARDVVGKRNVGVRQERYYHAGHRVGVELVAIDLEDGVSIYCTVSEHDSDYGVEAHTTKRMKKG